MDFSGVLRKALRDPLGREEALYILRKVSSWDRFLELCRVASRVRDDEIGPVFKFDAFIGSITPCTTNPPCRYCSRSAGRSPVLEKPLIPEEIEIGARFAAEKGCRRVEIGGGTLWEGAGPYVMRAVEAVKRAAPGLEIWVNVGPALTREDLVKLKDMGVSEVCSSLETVNRKAFEHAKPGDSFEARLRLIELIEEVGLKLTSVMMVGLPGTSYEDYVEHIFFLSRFSSLKRGHFPITGFRPIPGTPFENMPMASPVDVAKVGAVARLVLRSCDISFGGIMNDPRLLPIWVAAGANRAIHLGVHVHRASRHWGFPRNGEVEVKRIGDLELVNMLPLTTRIVKQLGMTPDVEL